MQRPPVDTRPGDGRPVQGDELDALQRRLLAKAIAIVMSPSWGEAARPAEGGDKTERSNGK